GASVPDSIPSPVPAGSSGCPDISGTNVRVNQECTNQAGAGFFGRTGSQNETSVAVNPTNPKNIVASQNDYHGGDATCGADFSLDGGRHWAAAWPPRTSLHPASPRLATTGTPPATPRLPSTPAARPTWPASPSIGAPAWVTEVTSPAGCTCSARVTEGHPGARRAASSDRSMGRTPP